MNTFSFFFVLSLIYTTVASIAVEIGAALDGDGVEIMFLNRQGRSNVRSVEEVKDLFKTPPSGNTPLGEACRRAFAKLSPVKPLLVLMATGLVSRRFIHIFMCFAKNFVFASVTDGVPNNLDEFTRELKSRDANRIFVSILACSDNEQEIGYLNGLDKSVPHLDVIDDYVSEKKEVMRRNPDFGEAYSLGDHCARFILGPIFSKYDSLDGF